MRATPEEISSNFYRLGIEYFKTSTLTTAFLIRVLRNVDSLSSVFFRASEADVPHPEEPQIRRVEVSLRRACVRIAGMADST